MLSGIGAKKLFLIVGGFLCYVLADGCTFSIGILYSEFLNVFHQSKVSTSVLPGLIYSVPQFLGLTICPLIDTIGSGYGAIIGGFILAISFFVSRFVISFQLMYVTLGFFASLGLEMTYVSGIMAVTKGFGEGKYLGLALGITVSGSGIGVFTFNPLLTYLNEEFTWQGTFIIESAIFLHIIVAGCLFRLAAAINTQPRKKKPIIQIEMIMEEKTNHGIVRQISQSHSAEELDIFREPHFGPTQQCSLIKERRSSVIMTKTQAKYCEPFYKPVSTQNKSSSLDRTNTNIDSFSVQLPVDERTVSFVRRISLYSSQNIKESSHNIKGSHQESQETLSSRPSLTMDTTESVSQAPNTHPDPDYDTHLITVHKDPQLTAFAIFLTNLKRSHLSLVSVGVWRNKNLSLFYLSTLLFAMSVVVVWTFSYNRSIIMGISETRASLLLSLVGAGSCAGQIFFGYISDFIPAISLYGLGCFTAGLVTLILQYITSYWWLAFLHTMFGFSQGVSYSLFSVILVYYTSMELYPASLAIYLLFSGTGNLIGTSLTGYFYDVTGDYDVAYMTGGLLMITCSAVVLPLMLAWHRRRSDI